MLANIGIAKAERAVLLGDDLALGLSTLQHIVLHRLAVGVDAFEPLSISRPIF